MGQLRPRLSPLPLVWALGCVAALGVALFAISWPYVDAYNNLREASAAGWRRSMADAFGGGVEYRPLLTLALKAAYETAGLRLWLYQALVLVQLALVLAILLWMFRPLGPRRGVAACIALTCVLGLHTSRILFLFVPLGAYSAALAAILLAAALPLDARARAYDWVLFPLTFAALLLLESGLLIAPLILVLWRMEAPGLSGRGVVSTMAAVAAYLAIRSTFSGAGALSVYTGSGLGFSELTPEQLRNVFEHAPWLFWLYNLTASLLTVLVSEPRAGVYRFVSALLRDRAALWQWIHIASSALTTAAVIAALAARPPAAARDRLLAAIGLVLVLAGSALGMLYTRDRIGLFAGVGYAMLVYVALAVVLERLPPAGWRRALAAGAVSAIAAGWLVRGVETYFQLRDTAWDYHLEWTQRYGELGGALPHTPLLQSLREQALGSTPPDPRQDPPWTYALFERRFSRDDPSSRLSVDDAADAAVSALSQPFDIRWTPEVDDAARERLEAELGLTGAQRVSRDPRGRTWEYRLRMPTRERVRAVVLDDAVEDTGRVDTRRFEIVE